MNLTQIRELKNEDLKLRLNEAAEEIFRLRCVADRLPPQKGAQIRTLRREVAQINTVLTQRAASEKAKA